MSQENVETVYRLYAASRRRDKEACVRESDPDVEVVSYLMGIEGTVYRGHAGLRRYIDDLFRAFPDWHPEILRTTDCGDKILAEVRMAGQGSSSGIAIEQTVWQVTTFHDGKMVGFHGYGSRAESPRSRGAAGIALDVSRPVTCFATIRRLRWGGCECRAARDPLRRRDHRPEGRTACPSTSR